MNLPRFVGHSALAVLGKLFGLDLMGDGFFFSQFRMPSGAHRVALLISQTGSVGNHRGLHCMSDAPLQNTHLSAVGNTDDDPGHETPTSA